MWPWRSAASPLRCADERGVHLARQRSDSSQHAQLPLARAQCRRASSQLRQRRAVARCCAACASRVCERRSRVSVDATRLRQRAASRTPRARVPRYAHAAAAPAPLPPARSARNARQRLRCAPEVRTTSCAPAAVTAAPTQPRRRRAAAAAPPPRSRPPRLRRTASGERPGESERQGPCVRPVRQQSVGSVARRALPSGSRPPYESCVQV